MDNGDIRDFAGSLPEVSEGSHAGCVTLLVRGRRFATLGWPSRNELSVVLDPGELDVLIKAEPDAVERANGAWGRRGHGRVRLASADAATVKSVLLRAWRRAAPANLRDMVDTSAE